MKIKSLILKTLAVAAFVASVSVSCSEISFIDINPPADLQSKIDSIAEANKKPESDTTWFTIATALVGAEDNSSGWWTEFSDYFTVSQGKRTVLEFYNHGKGVDNWNNYNVCLATGERDSDGYAEFFSHVLARSLIYPELKIHALTDAVEMHAFIICLRSYHVVNMHRD